MKIDLRYAGRSGVVSGVDGARLALASNVLREATYFRGELGAALPVREGLAALFHVAVSDLKLRPRDRSAFKAWLEQQDRRFLSELGARSAAARTRLGAVHARLAELDAARRVRRAAFEKARKAYIAWAVEDALELSTLLDPVVTVHPDEISFEAFSRDQSSYARLAIGYSAFRSVDAFECGTTNIDFPPRLHDAFDRLRTYRSTRFEIGPGGFASDTAGPTVAPEALTTVRERSVELPEGWLEGFLQVHGLFSMGLERIRLAPIDAYNIVRFIRRHRAKVSPRSLRWELRPGEPVRVVIEPFGFLLTCSPESRFDGPKERSIRTWGRDRLKTLDRVVHASERVDVFLAGTGLPSVWVCDLGTDCTFTLALSGWTDNDWVEGKAKFDLLTRRLPPSAAELTRVYEVLRELRKGTAEEMAARTGLGLEKTRSALSILAEAGRAMVDLASGLHRHRDLVFEPFAPGKAIAAAKAAETESDPRAKAALAIFQAGNVRIIAHRPVSVGYKVSGSAKGAKQVRVRPQLAVDHDGKILEASCTCPEGEKHGLTKGPCEHILALRLAHMERLKNEEGQS